MRHTLTSKDQTCFSPGGFQPLEVVSRGSETQLHGGENLNKLSTVFFIHWKLAIMSAMPASNAVDSSMCNMLH